jgi:ATP-binding cassette subfamily B (MDR/TAP) protein 1
MRERHAEAISVPATKAANYVNEVTDSIKTVAALGRERETMRVVEAQAKAAPERVRFLVFNSAGFAMGQAMILLIGALLFYWAGRRLAAGAVSHAFGLVSFCALSLISSSSCPVHRQDHCSL